MSNLRYVLTELENYLKFQKKLFIKQESRYDEKECDLLKKLDTCNFNPLNAFRANFTGFVRNPQGKRVTGDQEPITQTQVKQVIVFLKHSDAAPENLQLQLSEINNLIEEIVIMASEFLINQVGERPTEQKIAQIKDDFRKDIFGGLVFDSYAEIKEINRKPFNIH